MKTDRLSSWLKNEGFLEKKITPSSETKPKFTPKKTNSVQVSKPVKTVSQKQTNSLKTKKTFRVKPKASFSKTPKKVNIFSKNDPNFARPTTEKREKFHPTNYLKNNKSDGEIRIVPLGGMEQVGENLMFIEWGDDIVVIDTGISFPSAEHLGVDVLIPDISYLIKNKHKIKGVIYTHGHLDHIGGVPHIIPALDYPPLYASRLTKEMILANSEEYKIKDKLKILEINPKSKIKCGKFEFEFFHINHSIPDGLGIVINTPFGKIVHTSDFKFDFNPSDDQPIDLGRIAQIGKQGVALALVDSTNALVPGYAISESVVEKSLEKIFDDTKDRLVFATFASNIGRVSKMIEMAEKRGRTVFISGRSMERNMAISRKLNYLKCKEGTIQRISKKAESMPGSKVCILATGSQGEELAALTRMAAGTNAFVKLRPTDTIAFSSSTIPGNELAIVSVRNNLADLGVKVIDNKNLDIHVSGHAHAEQCKLMTSLLNPKYFSPIHGETFMRYGHRDMIVRELDFKLVNTFVMKNGRGIILSPSGMRLMTEKEALPATDILIELGEKVGEHVLSDRRQLADAGIICINLKLEKGKIKKFDIKSRGFLYMNMKHEIFTLLEKEVRTVFDRNYDPARPESALVLPIQKKAESFLLQKFKKTPVVEIFLS
jgi:ribonuclease J